MAFFAVPPDFTATICDRLVATGALVDHRNAALAVLALVTANLAPQSFASRASITELTERLQMTPDQFVNAVRLLGKVGAIVVAKHHSERRLAVTPDTGPQRGRPRGNPGAELVIGHRTFGASGITRIS